jgi:hypothetical protein
LETTQQAFWMVFFSAIKSVSLNALHEATLEPERPKTSAAICDYNVNMTAVGTPASIQSS